MANSSLLQTALQNLHVSQQIHQQSHTPNPPSSPGSTSSRLSSGANTPPFSDYDTDEDELVAVGKGTRPVTPTGGKFGGRLPSLLGGKSRDPLRVLPTHLSVRIFLMLDIRALARCDRVCKRWHRSSTLNYVWFLQNRNLLLPRISAPEGGKGGKTRKVDDEIEFYDPYDKSPRLSSLPPPPIPSSAQPQWTKIESKKEWKKAFKHTFKRTDPTAEPEPERGRVDIASLHSSGYSTPTGGHGYAGMGSGGASRWEPVAGEAPSSTERKLAARDAYKAMGGRKSRAKRKMGGDMGSKDKGGALDDGRFDAPW
ncbi:hypothetical protein B9479_004419 [Cryptococcus floricola]|uniref:F-box domain-containing protein n=1 Tax=Cryptococcus floricola TaxID=2591691 RepID=A0A5D3AXG8_9TREE|nr:hypothetical protein B9479_004419 [Cryptococcus floricola]